MHPDAQPAVYIMTNRKGGVLYTGVTSNLIGRVWQHRESGPAFLRAIDATSSFGSKYMVTCIQLSAARSRSRRDRVPRKSLLLKPAIQSGGTCFLN
ncbi:Excinuclease ABC, C subunit-like protein [Sphingopyxis alaskensis RB2256]|uniref:Excinuclease ABC, C subunit-like protein n=1 Tax=Sphingopyxis alaskensis (strain DSM 13593 / LMG 18877 / RB2256) TaxID=317655 RepID=Q1GSN7_SPHAL|nr:Excinuclease ABC, C subunit-like protein [Sphingopyxis alaskensis RB2256]